MKFRIEEKYLLAKVVEKEKVNLYTLLDLERFEKVVLPGVKVPNLSERSLVQVVIDISITGEKIQEKYYNLANAFVRSIEVQSEKK